MSEPNAGDVLGRYELLFPIAKGGMGQVWAARLLGFRGFQKLVAIKTVLSSDPEAQRLQEMLFHEANLASHVQSPHVAETLDFGEHQGTSYLVMEWVDGEPLSQLMRHEQGRLPIPVAVAIIMQACLGLQAAHQVRNAKGQPLGLIHRDISPQNIMIGYGGAVKIVDFGVAKATQSFQSESVGGELKGKFAFMSPEQVRSEQLDQRTDIFALGVVLYLITTGYYPFKGASAADTLYRITSGSFRLTRPRQLVAGYPPRLEAVVLKALARDREQRYASADDMLRDLEAALPPNARAGERELSEYMQTAFGERRQQQQERIAAALEQAERGTLPGVQTSLPSPRKESLGVSTLRGVAVTSYPEEYFPEASELPITGTGSAVSNLAQPQRRSKWPLRLGAVAGTLALLTVLVVGGFSSFTSTNPSSRAGAAGFAGTASANVSQMEAEGHPSPPKATVPSSSALVIPPEAAPTVAPEASDREAQSRHADTASTSSVGRDEDKRRKSKIVQVHANPSRSSTKSDKPARKKRRNSLVAPTTTVEDLKDPY